MRRGLEFEAALIKMSKLGNDGEPEPGPRLCLIEPLPPLHGPLPFCLGQPWSVVIHQDLEVAGAAGERCELIEKLAALIAKAR